MSSALASVPAPRSPSARSSSLELVEARDTGAIGWGSFVAASSSEGATRTVPPRRSVPVSSSARTNVPPSSVMYEGTDESASNLRVSPSWSPGLEGVARVRINVRVPDASFAFYL